MIVIRANAFEGCTALTSITIPKNVTGLGMDVFLGCSKLTALNVEEGNAYYDSRDGCNALIEKESNKLIRGCQNTRIPDGVTSIEDRAFKGCSRLTSITIPSSVTSIGNQAFEDCSHLVSVKIPDQLTSIGKAVWKNCEAISEIDCGMKQPFAISKDCFNEYTYVKAVLRVPDGSRDAYAALDGWKKFSQIQTR